MFLESTWENLCSSCRSGFTSIYLNFPAIHTAPSLPKSGRTSPFLHSRKKSEPHFRKILYSINWRLIFALTWCHQEIGYTLDQKQLGPSYLGLYGFHVVFVCLSLCSCLFFWLIQLRTTPKKLMVVLNCIFHTWYLLQETVLPQERCCTAIKLKRGKLAKHIQRQIQ